MTSLGYMFLADHISANPEKVDKMEKNGQHQNVQHHSKQT